MKVGIDVVTGFLGAGKSAFINSLINKTIADKEDITVVTCEKGNTSINEFNNYGQSVRHVCFMGDSLNLNKEIYKIVKNYKTDRIIIEYNGTETLEHLYKCVFDNETGKLVKLNTMYFVCDGVSIEFFVMNMGELLLPFIQNSDVLVINNCNNENNMKLENGIKLLEDLNHRAQIIKSKDKCNFDLALEQSNLLEGKFIRNIKMKIKEYMRK